MPSSKRPPLSRSSVAAALASTAGGRSGRLPTAAKTRTAVVWARIAASSDMRVEVARLVGMVLDAEQVVAEAVDQARGLEDAERVAGVGGEEVAELERVAVVQALVQQLRQSFHGHDFL